MFSYMALQLARPMRPNDPLQLRLSRLLAAHRNATAMSHEAKRLFYDTVTNVLQEEMALFEKGIWDYWNEPEKVQPGFQDWIDGLAGKEARKSPHPGDGNRYMVIALAFLIQRGSNSDQTM